MKLSDVIPPKYSYLNWYCLYRLNQIIYFFHLFQNYFFVISNEKNSLKRNGDDYSAFFHKVQHSPVTLISVLTSTGHIFGGFSTTTWQPTIIDKPVYFGSGECFLYRVDLPNNENNEDDHSQNVIKYVWSGLNTYYMMCTEKSIAMGGGGKIANFGFFIGFEIIIK